MSDKRMGKVHLEHIKMTSFGKFANVVIGPLSPGMNVVYGPNEAGKTTINQFVKGVLFGWPQARGRANSYKPENAERVGSLFFTNESTKVVAELSRAKAADRPEDVFGVLDDIDKETYETMFSLTSDELMGLERHDEVTTRLLTAGSGTSSSPAHALRSIDAQVKALMTKSSQYPDSISNLQATGAALKERISEKREQAERYRSHETQLEQLEQRRKVLEDTLANLNGEMESLRVVKERLVDLDDDIESTEASLELALASERATHVSQGDCLDEDLLVLRDLSELEELRIRDTLAELEEECAKIDHALELARATAAKSLVEYEVLSQDEHLDHEREKARQQRHAKIVASILVPLGFVALGAYLLNWALSAPSVSMLVVSLVVMAAAVAMAAVGIGVNLKPSRTEEEIAERLKKAEWVMRQDEKVVSARENARLELQSRIEATLAASHLVMAGGSLRRARKMLDAAQQARADLGANLRNRRALELQVAALENELASLRESRISLCQRNGLPAAASLADVEQLLAERFEERRKTMSLASETDRRRGEVSQELTMALGIHDFDELKLAYAQVEAKLKGHYRTLGTLIVARTMLEKAVVAWEESSQPEVYRKASELLALMTDGAWVQVRMGSAGEVEVVDAVKTVRQPHLLSVGTRQQLYLSLRIALLMTADSVGTSVPIMCDDILVNFDQKRRKRAAKALLELAKCRQVVLFTCHRDVVGLFQGIDPTINSIEL